VSSSRLSVGSSLEYYRKQAKALVKSARSGDAASHQRVASHIPHFDPSTALKLSDAQWVIARELGYTSWGRAKAAIEAAPEPEPSPTTDAQVPSIHSTDSGVRTAIGSEAVRAKTGRTWDEWLEVLDAAGCASMNHQQIVAVVSEHGVGSWWRQMVAVEYEKLRGLRVKNQSCAGEFQVSVSRTILADSQKVFDAWRSDDVRAQWLPEPLTIRKSTAPKGLLIGWPAGGSPAVLIVPKGSGKCSCTVDHKKLEDSAAVDRYRAFWSAALDRLKRRVEHPD
jgi:hypothetical protein